MKPFDLAPISAYAGLAAADARGQWTTADVAQWVYTRTDDIVGYRRVAPDTDDYRVERTDGDYIVFCLEHDDDDNVDGWTHTRYDRDDNECSTGGNPIAFISDLARAMYEIMDWAEA